MLFVKICKIYDCLLSKPGSILPCNRLILKSAYSADYPFEDRPLNCNNFCTMYLRRRCRIKGGVRYESWALVESVRTARGPRQRTVVTVGKLPGLDAEEGIGWEEIGRVLDGKPAPTASLFEQEHDIPSWATVNLKGIQVERLRHLLFLSSLSSLQV